MATFDILESILVLRRELALVRADEASEVDFGPNQIAILYKLTKATATMGELADHVMADKASVTRTVALLEESGFVKRVADEKDRRIVRIELTPKGRVQARKAEDVRDAIGRRLESTLPAAERKQFAALVRKLVENLHAKKEVRS